MLSTPKYELKLHQPISIILIGPSQIGKSTFVNNTFGMEIARVGENGKSCTSDVTRYCKVVPGANVLFIVDTPGISDTYTPDEEIKELVLKQLPMNSTTTEKCVFVFYKFYEEITGNARKSAKFAKKIINHYKNNMLACNIILMLTYSGIDSLKTFPANWKKKKLENPKAEKIKCNKMMLGAYLWEEMRKEKEEYFKEKIGVGSLEVLTVDFGPEEENGDVFVPIKTQDELNKTLGEKYPSLLPHMIFREKTGISLSTTIGVAVVSGATGVVGAALGASPATVGGLVIAPIALLGLIAGWLSLNKSEYIKVFLTHEHDLCRSMNGVMKFFDPSRCNVDLKSAWWDLIPRDNLFYLRGQEGYVILTEGKLSFNPMKSKNPDFTCIFVTKSGSNDHQMLLMMTDNTVKYYLVIEKNVLCVTNNIKLASNFTFMIADC